jgi:hypothetical protein
VSQAIHRGPDWLGHPQVRQLLQDLSLDDVEVQLVGFRRSFAGKAWPHAGLIRMVSEAVHPLRWLVTFLHELAHVLDWRERRRMLEAELERPLRRGDGRTVWRLDRTHGKLWSRQFALLAEASVAAGLFPGNEQAVLEHAASGAVSSDHVRLDLSADPRIEADDLRVVEEQARARSAQARQHLDDFRERFRPGVEVHFDAGPSQGVVTGKLVRVNRQTCTVGSGAVNWHVPHNFLRLGPAPADARPAQRPVRPRDRFQVGQHVAFRHEGARYEGAVLRVNQKTCTVLTDGGENWRVTFGLLKVVAEPKPPGEQ